jgi:membrane protease YdiL (CAAX protease family)
MSVLHPCSGAIAGTVRRRQLAAIAWVVVLAGTPLPSILWHDLLGRPGSLAIQMGQVLFLATLALYVRVAKLDGRMATTVHAYLAMAAGFLGLAAVQQSTGYDHWTNVAPVYQSVAASAAFNALPGVLMVLVALASGRDRRGLLLTRGDLRAPSRIPGTRRFVPWSRLGPVCVVVFAVPLIVQLTVVERPHVELLGRALALLPLALGFAALNAAQEEVRFRAVPLALLEPLVGAEAAIWMTSLAFGLGHWHGHPSGPTGVALTLAAGIFLAKSMLETRGSLWAWLIHACQDALIFVILVMSTH